MPPALEVEGVDFSYGSVQVLFGAGIAVEVGEVLAVVGPNGAGKTTLLRVVAGLEHPRRGEVRLFGEDVTRRTAEERVAKGMSVVFGGQALFPDLTVEANLLAGGQLLHRQGDALEERMAEAFTIFPALERRRRSLAVQLSGGEQQMLALAKAFLLRPRLLCIDELSMGLAPTLVSRLLEVVRSFKAAGSTVLLVEQSINVAASIADRAAFFEKGEVRHVGPSRELLESPEMLQSMFLTSGVE